MATRSEEKRRLIDLQVGTLDEKKTVHELTDAIGDDELISRTTCMIHEFI